MSRLRRASASLSAGIDVVVAVNATLLGAATVLAAYWWLVRTRVGSDAEAVAGWYEEAAALAVDVQEVTEHPDGSVIDRDRFQRRILPLSERLKAHARAAPTGVDGDIVSALHSLGIDCYEVGMEHTT